MQRLPLIIEALPLLLLPSIEQVGQNGTDRVLEQEGVVAVIAFDLGVVGSPPTTTASTTSLLW